MLTNLEIANGIMSIIIVTISTIIGLIIMSKYFKYKLRVFLLMGLSWIFMISPFWASSISVILALVTGEGLTLQMYLFIITLVFPLFTILFMIAFTDLKFQQYRIPLIVIIVIFNIFIYIYVYTYLFSNPSELGELEGVVDLTLKGFLPIYLIIMLIYVFVFGILISRESMKSLEPEIRVKGKFLLLAFILWIIGMVMDGVITLNIITLTIARVILLLSSISFYFGFILPEKVKNIFLKN